jgi:aquaporin Z
MNKYFAEFIGTFFLVLTIGCTVIGQGAGPLAPLAIGCALMVMIFAGGHISGGHFNPAVTLGVWLRGKCETKDVAPYMIFQVMGAVLAALVVKFLKGGTAVTPLQPATIPAFLAEFLFTFALVYVVLNVATAKGTSGNSFYGLAIGFTVLVGAFSVGNIPAERSTQRLRRASRLWGCRRGRTSGFTWSQKLPALRWRLEPSGY